MRVSPQQPLTVGGPRLQLLQRLSLHARRNSAEHSPEREAPGPERWDLDLLDLNPQR